MFVGVAVVGGELVIGGVVIVVIVVDFVSCSAAQGWCRKHT